ncbi:MAG: hypothetical protein WBA74_09645, partial [Cyclobacteriaceae bacterium]
MKGRKIIPSLGKKKKQRLIIFIHGLANKPPKDLLRKWYMESIWEGMRIAKLHVDSFQLEVVYWADLMYPKPLDPTIKDEKHPLYLDEPYVPFDGKYKRTTTNKKKTFLDKIEARLELLFMKNYRWINLDYIFDLVTRRIVRDLYIYYRKTLKNEGEIEEVARQVIRNRLIKMLKRNKNKKIMLISHSMGSIIAYDVLLHAVPSVKIDSFVTMGSPLGLPMIKREIFKELNREFDSNQKLPTPENVIGHWYNFSDSEDAISADKWLEDDYTVNSKG